MSKVGGHAAHVGAGLTLPIGFGIENAMPQRRQKIRCPFGELAAAVLGDALTVARDRGTAAGEEAFAWLTDTEADHPFSLRGVCAWLSILMGETVEPEHVASRIRSGQQIHVKKRGRKRAERLAA